MRLPVLRGPLRGAWWLVGSGGKVLRVLLGTYEREMAELFDAELRPGDTCLDVGAHVGFYTILASRLVGPEGRVVAFEPAPRNVAHLREHVRMNGAANVRVEEAAVAAEAGIARFGGGTGSGTGRLTGEGVEEVRTVTLDAFCAEHDLRPDVLKIDVEGAEARVLRGGEGTLRESRPAIFLSTHGAAPHAACHALLDELGYLERPIRGEAGDTDAESLWLPAAE